MVETSESSTVTFRYVFINTDYLFRQIKTVLKDTMRGAYTREECAIALRSFADKVEQKESINQLTLDEVQDHIRNALAGNRGIRHS